ncbi:hypothetical protein D3C84_1213450 [compost metagenome]
MRYGNPHDQRGLDDRQSLETITKYHQHIWTQPIQGIREPQGTEPHRFDHSDRGIGGQEHLYLGINAETILLDLLPGFPELG